MRALDQLVGEDASIAAVRDQVARLLRSASGAGRVPPVLILGETGTGKGLLAGAIHRAGPRASGPFVDINCAAIPEALLEAELFGFERGAFTDARQAKAGLFQTAHGGTIFLDEIGLMPASLQSKLLKVIEERSVRRLGSTRSEPVDVCVVAATSEDLAAAVQTRKFRPDLYHRLAVVTLVLPPLRARGGDVVILAEHLLTRICQEYGLPERGLTEAARRALVAYAWPGNVRELINVLERAALLTDEAALTAAHLALPVAESPVPPTEAATDDDERRRLLELLRATGWNFTRAAARLGVPRNTLRYRTERLGIEPEGSPARRRGGRPPSSGRTEPPAARATAPEVRRVTLLLARLLPPTQVEAWDARRALDATAEKIRAFGGHVESAADGAVLGAFGLAPEEDAPRRAAHAALAIVALATRTRADGGVGSRATIAVHTAALPVARDHDVPALADQARETVRSPLERLLAAAEPGTVVASAAACRFLASRFDLVPLDRPDALPEGGAFRVVRHAERGLTRFVGREAELRLLSGRFELAAAGQGQVVTIVGEPGIGKSRLLHELRRRLASAATWIEGHAQAFGEATPFHPVIDMLRRTYRIDDADSPAAIVDKLERGVRRLGSDLDWVMPFLRYVLSVDPGDPAVLAMDPRRRHAAIVRATHLLLERGAELRPHVVVVEDVHWADPATEDWLVRLVDAVATRRAMLVMTSRPGYRPRFGDRSFHTGLALSTLSDDDSLRIARTLLGVDELPPAMQALVVGKAEGNPFFLEELTRTLQEQGAVRRDGDRLTVTAALDVAVPDTVEAVLMARVDRLEPELRHLLQVASVIGRTVPFALLRTVTGHEEDVLAEQLAGLQAGEFLYETRSFPDTEHTFKHVLTQDVAYGSLAPDARRALHARIVLAIEALYPDRIREHVERLAHHALHGEQWPAAIRYFRAAGAKAFDRSANLEAVASLEQALAALAHLPDSAERLEQAIDIRLALRSTLLQLGEIGRIAGYLQEAEVLAATLGDRRRLAWVWTYMTIAALFAGDPARALEIGERACGLAEDVGDLGLRATARTPWGLALRERGDYRRAVALFREAIELLTGPLAHDRLGQAMPPSLFARDMAAVCLADLGEVEEATRLAQEAVDLAQRLELPFGLALARIALGYSLLLAGRRSEAADVLDLGLEIIRQRALPTWFPWAAAIRGYAMALSGEPAAGGRLLDEALARALTLPFLFGHSQWVAWRAHVHLLNGERPAAAQRIDEALRLSRARGERGYEAWALVIALEIEAGGGGAPAADGVTVERALALATELGMRSLVARCRALVATVTDADPRL